MKKQERSPYGSETQSKSQRDSKGKHRKAESTEKEGFKSLICSVIYPVLMIALAVVLLSIGETSIYGFISAVVCSIAVGAVMGVCRFYFFVIPLPFVFVSKMGCIRKNASMGFRIGFGLLCVALVALYGVMMYLLR